MPLFIQEILSNHVERAGAITQQLIELYSQLAFDKGCELRVRVETFQQAINTNNVTTAREEASAAASRHTIETIRTQGEIDGLLLALQHCDRVINHWKAIH